MEAKNTIASTRLGALVRKTYNSDEYQSLEYTDKMVFALRMLTVGIADSGKDRMNQIEAYNAAAAILLKSIDKLINNTLT